MTKVSKESDRVAASLGIELGSILDADGNVICTAARMLDGTVVPLDDDPSSKRKARKR